MSIQHIHQQAVQQASLMPKLTQSRSFRRWSWQILAETNKTKKHRQICNWIKTKSKQQKTQNETNYHSLVTSYDSQPRNKVGYSSWAHGTCKPLKYNTALWNVLWSR